MNKKKKSKPKARANEVTVYDTSDVATFINEAEPLRFSDLGLKLPDAPPTQVVSIRLPTALLNQLKAMGSQSDVPYQALIKLYLAESVARHGKNNKSA